MQRSFLPGLYLLCLAGLIATGTGAARAEDPLAGTKVHKAIHELETLQDKARAEKDIIKLNCINEKLQMVNGLGKIGEQAQKEAESKDPDLAQHGRMKLRIIEEKIQAHLEEARACKAPRASIPIDHVRVDVEIDPSLGEEDARGLSDDPLSTGFRMQFDIACNKATGKESRLLVAVDNQVSKDNDLMQLAVEVDGRLEYKKVTADGALVGGQRLVLVDRPEKPGVYSVGARMVFRGKTGKRRGLRVEASGGVELKVQEGKVTEVIIIGKVAKP